MVLMHQNLPHSYVAKEQIAHFRSSLIAVQDADTLRQSVEIQEIRVEEEFVEREIGRQIMVSEDGVQEVHIEQKLVECEWGSPAAGVTVWRRASGRGTRCAPPH